MTRMASAVMATVLCAGCMTSRVDETKNTAIGLGSGESVVILATSYHKGKAIEEDFVDCVSERVRTEGAGLAVFPDEEFTDSLFPWFEPRIAPQTAEALPELLGRPGVVERIRQNGIRYLVWLNGSTEQTSGGGSLACAVGFGGGGCFGFGWWEDDAKYDAAVWDLEQRTHAGSVKAEVHGTSMIPALIVPLPLIARTQAAACRDMARELRRVLSGAEPAA